MTPTTESSPTPTPKRKFPRLPGYGYAILLVGFAVATVALLVWWQGNKLAQIEAELDRTDPGWRMEEIWDGYLRTIPPPEKNSFLVVQAARKEIPKAFVKWHGSEGSLPWVLTRPHSNPTDAIEPNLIAEAKTHLETVQPALEIAYRTRNFPGPGASGTKLQFDAIGSLMQHVQDAREVYLILQVEGQIAALERDPKKALTAAMDCLHVARAFGDEPLGMVQNLRYSGANIAARIVELTLARNPGMPELLAELQQRLADEEAIPRLRIHARELRAMAHQFYDHFRQGDDTIRAMAGRYGLATPTGGVPLQSAVFLFTETDEHLTVLKRANRWVEIANAPEHERLKLAKAMPPMPQKYSLPFKLLMGLFDKDVSIPVEGELCRTAHLRVAIVGIACERHRLKTGSWPKSLDEIGSDILLTPVKDPFTGERLKYKFSEGVLTVYSVGPDGVDDGGKRLRTIRPGVGGDIGFQLVDLHNRVPRGEP
jgi:hypothetical protein